MAPVLIALAGAAVTFVLGLMAGYTLGYENAYRETKLLTEPLIKNNVDSGQNTQGEM